MISCSRDFARSTSIKCFLSKAVVPAAIPGGQMVCVFLKRIGQLSASELLHIEIAVAVRIGLEFDLRVRSTCQSKDPAAQYQAFRDHWNILSPRMQALCGLAQDRCARIDRTLIWINRAPDVAS